MKLMRPAYVKPCIKRHKNDAADAEAISEAVQRRSMRFVLIKQPEQQGGGLGSASDTASPYPTVDCGHELNQAHIVAPVGHRGVQALIAIVRSGANNRIPDLVRTCVVAFQHSG